MTNQYKVIWKHADYSEQMVIEAESSEKAVEKAIEILLQNITIRVCPLIQEKPQITMH